MLSGGKRSLKQPHTHSCAWNMFVCVCVYNSAPISAPLQPHICLHPAAAGSRQVQIHLSLQTPKPRWSERRSPLSNRVAVLTRGSRLCVTRAFSPWCVLQEWMWKVVFSKRWAAGRAPVGSRMDAEDQEWEQQLVSGALRSLRCFKSLSI